MGSTQTVSVSGVNIATYIDGEQGRPWIVLSNSLASDYSSWDDQLSLLTQNFRVLRYDTRGHGRSAAPEGPYTFDHLTGDVLGLMDHYGIEKANFLGLSMGGMTGLGVAIEHPSRIARLICCDARSDAPPPFVDNWTARIASVESAGNLEPVAAFNKGRWFTPAFIASHPYVVDKVMKMILATSMRGYIGCARALQKLDYKRHLGRIECPTLFVCGAQDGATPAAVMREMTGTRRRRRHRPGRPRRAHLQHREPRGLQHNRREVAVALKEPNVCSWRDLRPPSVREQTVKSL